MLFKDISILDENFEVRNHVDVLIEGDTIRAIKDSSENNEANQGTQDFRDEKTDEETISGDYIMMPGFFNAHAHSTMALMRGYGENMNLQDWLFKKIFPFEDHLTNEAVYYGTLLSMAESFKYGIVSTSDMYYFLDDMIQAILVSGAKSNVSRAIANPTEMPFDELVSIDEMKEMVKKYQGAGDGRVIVEAALHAEYTSNEDTARRLAALSNDYNLRMHVHVSETRAEHEECKQRRDGRTPTKYLDDCGIFDIPAIAAHCVWVEEDDRKILKDKGVTVATNSISNLKLASGICDVKALMEKNINIALGTDSVASNNNLNFFEEMKTTALLTKVKNMDPTIISPKEALMMATRNGALAQGRTDSGLIKEGYKADVILIKTDTPNMNPSYDLRNNIVFSASDSDIYMTVIDGRVVYRDGKYPTIDIKDTIEGVNRGIEDILKKVNS